MPCSAAATRSPGASSTVCASTAGGCPMTWPSSASTTGRRWRSAHDPAHHRRRQHRPDRPGRRGTAAHPDGRWRAAPDDGGPREPRGPRVRLTTGACRGPARQCLSDRAARTSHWGAASRPSTTASWSRYHSIVCGQTGPDVAVNRRPAGLGAQLARVDRIADVVAGPVVRRARTSRPACPSARGSAPRSRGCPARQSAPIR